MNFLEEKICQSGTVVGTEILKVDNFLNHLIDPDVMTYLADVFYEKFGNRSVTKILTIEASGIGIACVAGQKFHCPVLFAKKSKTRNLSSDVYVTQVPSFTHGCVYDVMVSKSYLSADDRVLIVDDFLANGKAMEGLMELCRQAGATVVGAASAIEKGFQGGGDALREKGVDLFSAAIVESMDEKTGIVFR